MGRLLGVITMTMLLAGCLAPEQRAIATVEKSVKNTLLEPSSARFERIWFVRDEERSNDSLTWGTVCGSVSGRNSFGGMTQPQRFVATAIFNDKTMDVSDLQFEGSGTATQAFERVYWRPCT